METRTMDQPFMAAVNSQSLVAETEPVKKASRDMPATTASGCSDCNIYLDFVAEPVVTLCGHLYCWPCIYEWLHPGVASENSSPARQQCPVCKATLSLDTLVPLYGHGGNSKKSLNGMAIPRRPMVHQETVNHPNAQSSVNGEQFHQSMEVNPQHQLLQHPYGTPPSQSLWIRLHLPSSTSRAWFDQLNCQRGARGVAEAVLLWMLRGQLPASLYDISPYHVAAQNMNPSLRRHQMEIESSLHQIWFFLFVLVVLCLLLF